jgi:hypothetical protein
MGGVDVFVLVILWSIVGCSSGIPNILHYSEERSSVVFQDHLHRTMTPIVLNGSFDTLYNKEVNNTVEYIFEFTKFQVCNSLLPVKGVTGIYIYQWCVEQYEIVSKFVSY